MDICIMRVNLALSPELMALLKLSKPDSFLTPLLVPRAGAFRLSALSMVSTALFSTETASPAAEAKSPAKKNTQHKYGRAKIYCILLLCALLGLVIKSWGVCFGDLRALPLFLL